MSLNRRVFLQGAGLAGLGLGLGGLTSGCHAPAASVRPGAGLPRSAPEAQGVSSDSILRFLAAAAAQQHELHSLMVVRHGHVVAEGWWAPYGPDLVHSMYSMSKSFTSTAVGLAVAEGRLTVEDKVVSFFPEDLPAQVGPHLAALRVRDLLTMSVGNERDPTGVVVASSHWVRTFLAQPIVHPPGSFFLYNSAATYLCSAIVQKLTGQRVADYLQPRLFAPLGIRQATWETCPRGINTGGWGLSVPTEALARLGQLYLQGGVWAGRQVLPAAWVAEATRAHVQQPRPAKPSRPHEQNDWLQGYGYQFWRSQHGAYRGDGAFGQFTIVLPDLDAVVVMTGESASMQGELDLVWEHLRPGMQPGRLPANEAAQARLRERLAGLSLPGYGGVSGGVGEAEGTSRQPFQLEPNRLGLTGGVLHRHRAGWTLVLEEGELRHELAAMPLPGGGWARRETTWPAPRIIAGGAPPRGTRYPVAVRAVEQEGRSVEFTVCFFETPHHDTITCGLAGDRVSLGFQSSIVKLRRGQDPRPVLVGRLLG